MCLHAAQLPHCAPVLEAGSLSGHSNIFPGPLFYTRPPKETECQDLHLQINTENEERSTSPGSISKRRPPASTGIEDQTSPPMGAAALRDRAGPALTLRLSCPLPPGRCHQEETVPSSCTHRPCTLATQPLGIPRVLDQVSGRPRPLQGL